MRHLVGSIFNTCIEQKHAMLL